MNKLELSISYLVFCHNPDACDLDIWNGYQGWIISGHTYSGQYLFPGIGTPILPVKIKNNIHQGNLLFKRW